MAFLSPLGLGPLRIGHSRHPRRHCIKQNPYLRKQNPSLRKQNPSLSRLMKAVVISTQFNVTPYSSRFQFKPRGPASKQKEKKNKKKNNKTKRRRIIAETTSDCGGTSALNLNEDDKDIVVRQVLSRLPVKLLMRFKCVCKHWLFLIQQDSSFSELHLSRSKARPGLFMAYQMDDDKDVFMTADLLFEGTAGAISGVVVHTVRHIDPTSYDRMLEPVNGLVGFFGQQVTPGVRISNLSTREETPWIQSTLLSKMREEERDTSPLSIPLADCNLGYDPATKKHKVLGIWKAYEPEYEVCEVLTVGDNEWRKIDEIPPYGICYYGSSVYLNGSIYYTTDMLTRIEPGDDKPKFLVAFDVGSEKFRAVRVPNFIFDGPADGGRFIFRAVKLLVLDGRLALLVRVQKKGCVPKLWISDGDYLKEDADGTWTEVPLELPFTVDGVQRRRGSFHPVLGTDQMVVTSTDSDGETCHSYNWKNMTSYEIDICGIPSSVPYLSSATSRMTAYFESLLSVQQSRP